MSQPDVGPRVSASATALVGSLREPSRRITVEPIKVPAPARNGRARGAKRRAVIAAADRLGVPRSRTAG
jgi:hypothetical protein